MVIVKCPDINCSYKTADEEPPVVAALLNIHALSHSQATAPPQPKLDRPHIDVGIEEETWNNFIRRWKAFRTGSYLTETSASTHLFQCASETLGDLILKSDPHIQSKSENDILDAMRSFAVIPVAKGVIRSELMQLQQAPDEQFRTFAARVKGKAETCGFTTTATCICKRTVSVDYTEETVRDVLLAGISDLDIRREALSAIDIQEMSLNNVISFVEGREMARNATPHTSLSAVSSFKRNSQQIRTRTDYRPELPRQGKTRALDRTATAPCPDCGKQFNLYKQRMNGSWNTKPHNKCVNCWRQTQQRKSQEINAATLSPPSITDMITQISSIDCTPSSATNQLTNTNSSTKSIKLEHNIFEKNEWQRVVVNSHPTVEINVKAMGTNRKAATVQAIADTGAQSNLWGLKAFKDHGFSTDDLLPVQINMRAANKNPINVIGAFKASIGGYTPDGKKYSCITYIYVSDSVSDFYLSCDSMLDLGIINRSFPMIGNCVDNDRKAKTYFTNAEKANVSHIRSINAGCAAPGKHAEESCKCPQREAVPKRPSTLPFPPTQENNENMRQWLLNHFGKSTFNTCPHRPLPCMSGPPIEIHMDELAIPKTCHTPAPIPLHWQEKVQSDLLRDEALGVIEKVPYGEPVTWCHRMVVTRKHDGTPRRTVDLSPLNRFCKRETFASDSPFQLARRIPGNTWKTVTDAWNGYHSVPLRESDRKLTTFITPFGRWRYTRAPQGFLSSGDGYNRRFDAILSDFQRKERCVDDTIFHDNDLETHWWRTIEFLSMVGSAGIVLNPDKFQFAQREVKFAGFNISEETIKPLSKYIEAIRSFPTPTSTTDIRSWFGLINQVSNYGQLRDAMEHFRPFLSPKYKFFWTPVLDKAFNNSKEIIINQIIRGVEIFDLNRPTCLRPDWSAKGIGYFLLQKHCNCESGLPDCCTNGWKISLAGSRFLNGAEQRYAPIEGEALAVAWGLEQTRYFTQGCHNLLVVTDHKPLKKIFSDRTLDEISNTRLFRLKQRTMPWHFRIEYMPGKSNSAADATSRHPSPILQTDAISIGDTVETIVATTICREAETICSISWDRIAQETQKDKALSTLLKSITDGSIEMQCCHEYSRYVDSLYTNDGVVLYNDRVIIPPILRQTVLSGLHAAHQGISAMELRAQSIVFWPGITKDIESTRAKCMDCNKNAPSQTKLPSEPATPPSTPFEKIYADFFDFAGHHYLVIGDRLSGWPEILSTPTGTPHAGARGLVACLRSFFATFGVPEELSSDGGPEFIASTTQEFLKRWNIKHRKSSAYNPQSNGRAEVAVKSAKRLLRSNISPTGTLDNDKLLRALLHLRNTPDPDCNKSPAQIVYGRPIRDAFSFVNRLEKFSNQAIHPIWREAWAAKESALRTRFVKSSESLNEKCKWLSNLNIGDHCFIQNQTGNSPKRWDKTGIVMEIKPHDQYVIKVDGSGRLTTRNRRFLRAFKPASMEMPEPLPLPHLNVAPALRERNELQSTSELDGDDCPHPKAIDLNNTPDENQSESDDAGMSPSRPLETPVMEATPAKLPVALKRLLPHNKEGSKEAIPECIDDGRRSLRPRRTRHLDL